MLFPPPHIPASKCLPTQFPQHVVLNKLVRRANMNFQTRILLLNTVVHSERAFVFCIPCFKGAGSFHIHRKTMKELGALAVLGIRERPNLAQNLVTHRH